MKRFNVPIGEYKIAAAPAVLTTVLGSCVGVILHDKLHGLGGLAHIYLPEAGLERRVRSNPDTPLGKALKYADRLIPEILRQMLRMGAEKRHCFAYVVGGASIYEFSGNPQLNIGARNLEKTFTLLDELGLRYMRVKVGGKSGRKVSFSVGTGDIEIVEFKNGS
ncbi:MAG TPA: hypothetical protein ENN69_03065 [Spirochaetia bacterium]|nr:hypothetical protein [Spirochaetia bacterium]